jgi:hypothetical protein
MTDEQEVSLDVAEEVLFRKWPQHLRKAASDCWPCAAMVAGIGVVVFTGAKPDAPGWVLLTGIGDDNYSTDVPVPAALKRLPMGRGLAVRLEDIRWVVDWDS